jgi:DNA-directed RNA polymerase subunit beta
VGGGLSIYNFKKKLYMAAGNATPRFFHRGLDLQARNLFNSRKDSNDFRYAMEKYQGNFQTTSKITLKKNLKDVSSIQIYLAEKRRIQVGDKMSGRHGNKGIISQVLPIEDMPFLPDGKPLDMVLNPLGVPSRMNVGQIYECLLGLAGKYLGENFKVFPFDEIYGAEASRSFVFSKLYSARLKTGKQWLFNQNSPGKIRLYDGRTGETFDQAITVGYSYMLRLVHMVDDKIHARSTGPYSLVTQQPLRGRSKQGGQRLGEMEVWALEGYGAAFTLLEMLTIKSDDMTGRMTLWSNLILNKEISIGTPESFKVLICELQALCLDIGLFKVNSKNI